MHNNNGQIDFGEELEGLLNLSVDFHSRHSLALLAPVGSPLDALFQDSRTFRSNQLELFKRNIVGKLALLLQFVFSLTVPSIFRQKEFRIALAPNQNLKVN